LKIVFAFDGSAEAQEALKCLLWFKQDELKVMIVTVVANGPALDDKGDAVEADPAEINAAQRSADEVVSRLTDLDIHCEPRVLAGDPPQVIMDVARSEGADLIVTGRRGLSRARRVMFGSVSSKVLSDAPCPVLIGR